MSCLSSLSSLSSPPYNPPLGRDRTGQAGQTKQKLSLWILIIS